MSRLAPVRMLWTAACDLSLSDCRVEKKGIIVEPSEPSFWSARVERRVKLRRERSPVVGIINVPLRSLVRLEGLRGGHWPAGGVGEAELMSSRAQSGPFSS